MLKVLLVGSPSAFTSIVLRELISAGVPIVGTALHLGRPPGSSRGTGTLPVSRADDVEAVAAARGIPVIDLGGASEANALAAAARHAPDLLAVACYPKILDERWLTLAPCGTFNLHPSLLPAYRGPSPLFWQFRYGEKRMGITLHRVSAAVDAGPVVSTASVAVAPGASAGEVQALLVRKGTSLLVDALQPIEAGTLTETPQDETRASWFGWPDDDAFRVPTSWTAERAFRFVQGVRGWGRVFTVEARHETLIVEGALDFEAQEGVEGAVRRENRMATIGFAAGTLRARCSPASGRGRKD